MSWSDFNDAEQDTFNLIPNGTLCKLHMKIRPGGFDDPSQGWTGGLATRNDNSGAVYLNAECTVMGGQFDKRKVFHMIGLHSPKGPEWANMGRTLVRSILESARSIEPDDMSEKAMQARRINGLADLDGLTFVAKIGVSKGKDGYEDKNQIAAAVPCTHKEYHALMAGSGATATTSAAASAASKPASTTPAWAQ